MRVVLAAFLFALSPLLAHPNIKLIDLQEAPAPDKICHLYLIYDSPQQEAMKRLSSFNISATYILPPELDPVPFLQDIAQRHIGEEVAVAVSAEVINFLLSHLKIAVDVALFPQGCILMVEGDADTLYLRKNSAKLWKRLPFFTASRS